MKNQNKTLTEIIVGMGYRNPTSKELTRAIVWKMKKELDALESVKFPKLGQYKRRNFLRKFIEVTPK